MGIYPNTWVGMDIPKHMGENGHTPKHMGGNGYIPKHMGGNGYIPKHMGGDRYTPKHMGGDSYIPKHMGGDGHTPKQKYICTYICMCVRMHGAGVITYGTVIWIMFHCSRQRSE